MNQYLIIRLFKKTIFDFNCTAFRQQEVLKVLFKKIKTFLENEIFLFKHLINNWLKKKKKKKESKKIRCLKIHSLSLIDLVYCLFDICAHALFVD